MSNRFANITQGLRQRVEQDAPPTEVVTGDDTALSESETKALHYYEGVIERGLKTFFEVGDALTRVRDLRLYRVEYGTFEAYCADRWGLKRQRAYELMGAAGVVTSLSEISDMPAPERESHAAALAKLKDPAQQREAWELAQERSAGTVTAADIAAAVREVQGQNVPLRSAGHTEVIEGEVVQAGPTNPSPPQQYVDDLSPLEAAALRERNAELERRLAAAQTIIEEYQEHITRAQNYKPTSDRGEAVSPLLRALERVWGVLRGG